MQKSLILNNGRPGVSANFKLQGNFSIGFKETVSKDFLPLVFS